MIVYTITLKQDSQWRRCRRGSAAQGPLRNPALEQCLRHCQAGREGRRHVHVQFARNEGVKNHQRCR